MATIKFANISHIVDVAQFGGLHGIRYDLDSTVRLAERLKQAYESGFPGGEIVEGLSMAIVVRYSRAFVGGVRQSEQARQALSVLSEDQARIHESLINMRDKHIAHSVNAQEETHVVAQYYEERVNDEGFVAVTIQHGRSIGFGQEELEPIIEVGRTLLAEIDKRLEQEEKRLLPSPKSLSAMEILKDPRSNEWKDFTPLNKRRKKP